MPTPPAAALAAILAGQSRITRRCEIYESDAVTPWQPGMIPRMMEGSVSVDYSRADRRNLDLTLNNSDGLISHNPNDGLWYDKIIKIFRGVKWENTQKIPKIAFWDIDSDIKALRFLQRLGFSPDRFTATSLTANDIFEYDILVIIRQGSSLSTNQVALAALAFSIGISVFTMSPHALATDTPLFTAVTSETDSPTNASVYSESPESFGSPFSQVGPFTINAPVGGAGNPYRLPTTLGAGAQAATIVNYQGSALSNSGYGLIYLQSPTSIAKWVHYSVPLYDASIHSTAIDTARFIRARDGLIHSAMYWIYAYEKDQEWECQVGEFMINQITTPRAPKTVQVTATDYQKKCATSDFDNSIAYDPGENVLGLIRDFASNAGITKFRLDDGVGGTLETNSSFTFASSSPRWDAMSAVATASNLEIFFDAEGYLVTRTFFDPSTSAPTLVLKVGEPDGNLVDWSEVSDDTLLYNRIVVSGTGPDSSITGNIYQGIVENREPSSPTRIQRLGARSYYFSSSFFTSDAQCFAYARSLLHIHALENFQISYSSIVFAWLEAGEIIEIDKPDTDPTDPTRFLNISFTIPLTLDTMQGSAKRITIVG